jgi:guanosine-3',5'-bis(diphosphate) 3'-pyrophosphohydrolase
MPVHSRGRGCYQWGHHGKIYCGPGARKKAERQGRAAYAHGYQGRELDDLSDLDRRLLDAYHVSAAVGSVDDIGAPAGLVADQLGLSTAAVTQATKRLAALGLVEDTGYAMKFERSRIGRGGSWQWTDRPKGERGMLSRPGASTVWRTTQAGVDRLAGATHEVREGAAHFPEGPLEADAANFAERAHARVGQTRKYTLDPYIVHPGAVADIVRSVPHDEAMLAAAWLHDTVEDAGVTLGELRARFGADVADLVGWLTDVSKPSDGNRAARKAIDRQHTAGAPPRAKTVKLADLIHNSASILAHDPKFAVTYLREKRALLDVLRDGDPTLWAEADRIVREGQAGLREGHVVRQVPGGDPTARQLDWARDLKATGFILMPAETFLRLTLPVFERDYPAIEADAHPVASYQEWADRAPPPFLKIERGDAEHPARVIGHEGRHRAAAMLRERGPDAELWVAIILAQDGYALAPYSSTRPVRVADTPHSVVAQHDPIDYGGVGRAERLPLTWTAVIDLYAR